MKVHKTFLAALLIAFTACLSQAQIFGTVRGTVLDPQGAVIYGATVTLKARGSAFVKTTETDGSGWFTFTTVPADSYTVEVTRTGFETQSQAVNVAILGAPILRFTLSMAGVES